MMIEFVYLRLDIVSCVLTFKTMMHDKVPKIYRDLYLALTYRPWYHPEIPIPARDVKAIYQFLCHVLPTIVYVMQIRKENN